MHGADPDRRSRRSSSVHATGQAALQHRTSRARSEPRTHHGHSQKEENPRMNGGFLWRVICRSRGPLPSRASGASPLTPDPEFPLRLAGVSPFLKKSWSRSGFTSSASTMRTSSFRDHRDRTTASEPAARHERCAACLGVRAENSEALRPRTKGSASGTTGQRRARYGVRARRPHALRRSPARPRSGRWHGGLG